MNEEIKQIAARLAGLRDAVGASPEEMAAVCHLTPEEYLRLESGTVDISVSILTQIAHAYGVELTALLFGSEPKMNSYFVTRRGKGVAVERVKAYKYQSLAAGFDSRIMEPFLVTVAPNNDEEIHFDSHEREELNYIESGTMEMHIDGKTITLHAGDTIVFDSRRPHGLRAIGDEPLKFIAVIVQS